MGYYVSSMIGIRTGGVFSDPVNMDALRHKVSQVLVDMQAAGEPTDIPLDNPTCISPELSAHKGSYVVIAGVFNYWTYDEVAVFARRLSKALNTEVMLMTWDEQTNHIQSNVFLAGRPLLDVAENPIGRVLRRVAG